jgi:hypothetical protein
VGSIVQSVTEIRVQLYNLLQNFGCNYTVCNRIMGVIVLSVTELWVQLYSLLQNYGFNYRVCYRTMGISIESVTELWVQEYSLLPNYECKSKNVLQNYWCIFIKIYRITGANTIFF